METHAVELAGYQRNLRASVSPRQQWCRIFKQARRWPRSGTVCRWGVQAFLPVTGSFKSGNHANWARTGSTPSQAIAETSPLTSPQHPGSASFSSSAIKPRARRRYTRCAPWSQTAGAGGIKSGQCLAAVQGPVDDAGEHVTGGRRVREFNGVRLGEDRGASVGGCDDVSPPLQIITEG